jgi:hypothetical protein
VEEIIISLNPWPFVYLVLSLHKEVFPEIVDLCILVLLIASKLIGKEVELLRAGNYGAHCTDGIPQHE